MLLSLFTLVSCSHTHDFGEWQTYTEATCLDGGILTRKCECGAIDNMSTAPTGHDMIAADCDSPRECRVCGYHDGLALGHNIQASACVDPSTCTRCEAVFAAPLGHVVGNSECEDLVCQRCNQTVKKQSHELIVVAEKEVTLNSDGYKKQNCTKCTYVKNEIYKAPDPNSLGIPIVYINDYVEGAIPLSYLSKNDGEISVKYSYYDPNDASASFDGYCKIKIQGSSSATYPKKNFTVKLYKDEQMKEKNKVDFGWGKQNKYCMKANYIDVSHARNIVSARIYAQVTASRSSLDPRLTSSPNYGLIDGFPVAVYLNGEFHGLYTMNIPKDQWQMGMEEGEELKEAMLVADQWGSSISLFEEISEVYEDSGWEVEFCSTEDNSWIRTSFNKLIRLLNCGDNERIKAELDNHLDVAAAIDNVLFTYFINGIDNVSKNTIWITYDGQIWIPCMYDMDSTFGIHWNGQPIGTSYPYETYSIYPTLNELGEIVMIEQNKMYQVLFECYADDLEARWAELREEILTVENAENLFNSFFALIPEIVFKSEAEKWVDLPYVDTNRNNMITYLTEQLQRLDAFFYNFNK